MKGFSMTKTILAAAALAAVLVVPAQAHKSHPAKSHACTPHRVAYVVSGTLVSQGLVQTAGQSTAKRSDDRYSGDVTVNVTKANHHATTGLQTYTVTNVHVRFFDRNHDGTKDQPVAGDRVKLIGKITKLARHCDQTGFQAQITIRRVVFHAPKS